VIFSGAGAFKAAVDARAGAVLVTSAGALFTQARRIAELAAHHRLPAIYELRPLVDAGGWCPMVRTSSTSGDARDLRRQDPEGCSRLTCR